MSSRGDELTRDRREIEFPIDAFSKACLLEGIHELGWILKQDAAIAYEAKGGADLRYALAGLAALSRIHFC